MRVPIVSVEIVFLVAFGGWTIVRAYSPSAVHTEQPMDLLFLSAIWVSPTYPPPDPWLAGYAISYYYFGYWLLATVAHLAAQPPEIAYNVGQACWFGLLVIGCYGLGSNLAVLGAPGGDRRAGGVRAALGGLLTAITVAVVGNVRGLLDAVDVARGSTPEAWWWWHASRVIHDVDLRGRAVELIDEFPAFSYVLGDNHPHLLAMPFLVLVIALSLGIFLGRDGDGGAGPASAAASARPDIVGRVPFRLFDLGIATIVTGSLLAINTWDFPVAWLLPMLALGANLRTAVGVGLVLGLGAGVAYVPYLLSAQSQVSGVRPNLFHPTAVLQFMTMFGFFIPGFAALLWRALRDHPPGWRRLRRHLGMTLGAPVFVLILGAMWAWGTGAGRHWLAGMPVSSPSESHTQVIIQRWREGGVTLIVVAVLLGIVLSALHEPSPRTVDSTTDPRDDRALRFVLQLAAVGLGLLLVPEVGYLADSFGTRMNTLFKLYYAAWLLLGVTTAFGIVQALSDRSALRVLGVLGLGVLVAGTVYPLAAVYSRAGGFRSPSPTLDALAYLATSDADEMAAIEWIRRHTRTDATIVQAVGASYRADQSRISVATGRPTLLGWQGHEVQWRGADFARQTVGRVSAVRDLYGSNEEAVRATLEQWHVDYVYVGPRERAAYGIPTRDDDVLALARTMDLAFRRGDVRIYRRRD